MTDGDLCYTIVSFLVDRVTYGFDFEGHGEFCRQIYAGSQSR
jgi:hypothetical protein